MIPTKPTAAIAIGIFKISTGYRVFVQVADGHQRWRQASEQFPKTAR